jgi:hypothetical protein
MLQRRRVLPPPRPPTMEGDEHIEVSDVSDVPTPEVYVSNTEELDDANEQGNSPNKEVTNNNNTNNKKKKKKKKNNDDNNNYNDNNNNKRLTIILVWFLSVIMLSSSQSISPCTS